MNNFDVKMAYGFDEVRVDSDSKKHYYRGGKEYSILENVMDEMKMVSSLIADLTVNNASKDELARVIRYSRTVIDAQKHKLDYKQSYVDNGIDELRKKYQ